MPRSRARIGHSKEFLLGVLVILTFVVLVISKQWFFPATLLNPNSTQQIQDIYGNSVVSRVSLGYGDSVQVETGIQYLVHCPTDGAPSGYGFHSPVDFDVPGLRIYEYTTQQSDERDKAKSGKARWNGRTFGYDVNDDLDVFEQGGVYLVSAAEPFEFSCTGTGLGGGSSSSSTSSQIATGPYCVMESIGGGATQEHNYGLIPACPPAKQFTCPNGYLPSCLFRSTTPSTRNSAGLLLSCSNTQLVLANVCGRSPLVPAECDGGTISSCTCPSGNCTATAECTGCLDRNPAGKVPYCINNTGEKIAGTCEPANCSANHDACAQSGLACNTFTGECVSPCTGQGNVCATGESCDTNPLSANSGKCVRDCTISGVNCPTGTTCNSLTKLCEGLAK
jgi:hypothetical protein